MSAVRSAPRSLNPALPAVLASLVAAPILAWVIAPADEAALPTYAVVVCSLALVPFVVGMARGRLDLAEPIYGISAVYAVLFGIRALYVQANPEAMARFSARQYEATLVTSLELVVAGFALLLVGYFSGLGDRLGRIPPALRRDFASDGAGVRAAAVFGLGAMCALYVLLVVGRTSTSAPDALSGAGSENLLSQGTLFMLWGLALAAVLAGRRRSTSTFFGNQLLLAMIAGLVAFAILNSYKSGLLSVTIIVLVVYHYRVRRLSARMVAVAALFVVFVVFPFIGTQRDLGNQGLLEQSGSVTSRISASTSATLSALREGGPQQYVDFAIERLMDRETGVDAVAMIVGYTPKLREYQGLTDYAAIVPAAILPRAVWPTKPSRFAVEFGRTYLGRTGTNTSFAVTNVGDLYLHGGVWLVLVGMFVLGVFFRAVYFWLVVRGAGSDASLVVYAGLMTLLLSAVEGEIYVNATQGLKTLAILVVLTMFMSATLSRRSVRGPSRSR